MLKKHVDEELDGNVKDLFDFEILEKTCGLSSR